MKAVLSAFAVSVMVAGLAAAGAAHLLSARPAVIATSPGGAILEFITRYESLRRSDRQVRIDGMCMSACTLITGLVPLNRICVTPFAQLAFHSASDGPFFSAEWTRIMWHMYPPKLRELLRTKYNWDGEGATANHPELIYVEGDDLHSIIDAC